jgi:hypothetical protein
LWAVRTVEGLRAGPGQAAVSQQPGLADFGSAEVAY